MNWEIVLVCGAALVAGAVNSVAGGGTLLTFPVLIAVLTRKLGDEKIAAVVANQTSTMALIPGIFAAAWGYRGQLKHSQHWLKWLLPPSLVGGLIGGLLIVTFPDQFSALVPWLILTAAVLFVLQPQIARWTGVGMPHAQPHGGTVAAIVIFQFFVAVYGGYFGAGIGILMLAEFGLLGFTDIHHMIALRSYLALCINGVAAIYFIVRGAVSWPEAILMTVAQVCGGYGGAVVARRLSRATVRWIVVGIGLAMAASLFIAHK
jgi:hypothetical protein